MADEPSSESKRRHQHVHLLNGVRVPKALFYKYLTGAVIFAVFFLALLSYAGWRTQAELRKEVSPPGKQLSEHRLEVQALLPELLDADHDVGSAEAAPDNNDAVDSKVADQALNAILRMHLDALGGGDYESLTLNGKYFTSGVPFQLTTVLKRPSAFKQELHYSEVSILAGVYDGEYWEENPLSLAAVNEASVAQRLNGELLMLQCAHLTLAWQYLDGEASGVSLEGEAEVNEIPSYIILNEELIDVPVRHYLHKESGLEIRREAVLELDGLEYPVVIDYEYGQREAAPNLAQRYRILFYGQQLALVRIDTVRPNAGVTSWMFDKP